LRRRFLIGGCLSAELSGDSDAAMPLWLWRTVVVNLMNRMLLDNGMSPCILDDPKVAANCCCRSSSSTSRTASRPSGY
jgi:hypothetical protein